MRWSIAVALTIAFPIALASSEASARPHRLSGHDPGTRLSRRVVIEESGVRISNCIFSTAELPERPGPRARTRDAFEAGEPIWGRCYLPDPPGRNQPGDLVDLVTIDRKLVWRQGYHLPLAPAALSRSVAYGALLRTLLAALEPGTHYVEIEGTIRRKGRVVKLYQGSFRYVR